MLYGYSFWKSGYDTDTFSEIMRINLSKLPKYDLGASFEKKHIVTFITNLHKSVAYKDISVRVRYGGQPSPKEPLIIPQ